MSPKFPNDKSGVARLEVAPFPSSGSKLRDLNGCSVDMLPVAHPGQRISAKLSTVSAYIWVIG